MANNAYTNEELTDMVFMYGMAHRNGHGAERLYRQRCPNRRTPHHGYFATLYNRLRTTGTLRVIYGLLLCLPFLKIILKNKNGKKKALLPSWGNCDLVTINSQPIRLRCDRPRNDLVVEGALNNNNNNYIRCGVQLIHSNPDFAYRYG